MRLTNSISSAGSAGPPASSASPIGSLTPGCEQTERGGGRKSTRAAPLARAIPPSRLLIVRRSPTRVSGAFVGPAQRSPARARDGSTDPGPPEAAQLEPPVSACLAPARLAVSCLSCSFPGLVTCWSGPPLVRSSPDKTALIPRIPTGGCLGLSPHPTRTTQQCVGYCLRSAQGPSICRTRALRARGVNERALTGLSTSASYHATGGSPADSASPSSPPESHTSPAGREFGIPLPDGSHAEHLDANQVWHSMVDAVSSRGAPFHRVVISLGDVPNADGRQR